MLKFIRLFFMGVKDCICEFFIPCVIILSPIFMGVVIELILIHFISDTATILITTASICFGYSLFDILPHCRDAMKYQKENDVSLKEAWYETYPKGIFFG